ncbi:hypothetical protein LCL96_15260 [Rossellomorea aquimaris]|uniref:hypothetical protein n=1 Tax=Rossellomorea aquimaris TaxID=189382 RepID=UPI001CD38135|nr:hypothetical protein [Rossellomorea aquimaris]MCA1060296.1 hypothetical protein [Rossellomorea aquimaris]
MQSLVVETNFSHQKISELTGRRGNWFNDAFNNNEDIQISSLSKVLSVLDEQITIEQYSLSALFSEKSLKISRVLCSLPDESEESLSYFISTELDIFSDLLADLGSLNYRGKLSIEESVCFRELEGLIRQLKLPDKED